MKHGAEHWHLHIYLIGGAGQIHSAHRTMGTSFRDTARRLPHQSLELLLEGHCCMRSMHVLNAHRLVTDPPPRSNPRPSIPNHDHSSANPPPESLPYPRPVSGCNIECGAKCGDTCCCMKDFPGCASKKNLKPAAFSGTSRTFAVTATSAAAPAAHAQSRA